jgi:ribosomal protein S18 acetylase RimI-like enzyme
MIPDDELYRRGIQSALACWAEIARWTDGATIVRAPGMTAAVFTSGREREVYNNAVLDRGLSAHDGQRAIDAMEAAYAAAGLTRFAAWVHESDEVPQEALLARGYSIDEATRAMGMQLGESHSQRPSIQLEVATWAEYLRILDVPGILVSVDPDAFHVVVAQRDGEGVATGMAFDHAGDCGIFNVTTSERARRQGFGRAVVSAHLGDARSRGCVTASLQSTEMAEHLYASVGFRDLGRILEFVPNPRGATPVTRPEEADDRSR